MLFLKEKEYNPMAKGLKGIDSAAAEKGKGIETLWQFVKFIFVSLGAFVIQTCLPYLIKLPMSEEFLHRSYDLFNLGIFSSEKVEMATGEPTGLGLFIALTSANIIAQIVSFFVNKEKTFNSGANTKVVFPIYIIFTIALLTFSAWLQPFLVGFFNSKGLGESAIALSGACCGAIQFFLYFPVDKILFHKKKEETPEVAVEAEEVAQNTTDAE